VAISIVQLGSPRRAGEGPRLGTVRRPPRGVRKADYARQNFFDAWLPELAPSAPLVKWALSQPFTPARWESYSRRYRAEMRAPAAARLIVALATLSRHADFAVGCYCDDETRCHRSLLAALLRQAGGSVKG
jgi:uncharacterized protein YeaO (DUF488 family)